MRNIYRIVFVLPLLAGMLSFSCSSSKDEDSVVQEQLSAPKVSWPLTRSQQEQVQGLNDFALKLLSLVSEKEAGKSVLISPISVTYALGMLSNGASGATRNEITAALGFSRGDAQGVDDLCASLIARSKDDGDILQIANALYMRNGVVLKETYKSTMSLYYNALVDAVDFASPATLADINHWVEEHTNAMIPSILEKVDPDMVMLMLNAVSMQADWEQPFRGEDTDKANFFNPDGTQSAMFFMRQNAFMDFASTRNGQLLRMPYRGGRYAMNIFLPAQYKQQPLEALGSMSGRELVAIQKSLQSTPVRVLMPRFETDGIYELTPMLRALGINKAFSGNADFSNITESTEMQVSFVKHKSHIRVYEKGTEAAAVTAIGSDGASGSTHQIQTFQADHPFLYFITEEATGVILFIGTFYGQ